MESKLQAFSPLIILSAYFSAPLVARLLTRLMNIWNLTLQIVLVLILTWHACPSISTISHLNSICKCWPILTDRTLPFSNIEFISEGHAICLCMNLNRMNLIAPTACRELFRKLQMLCSLIWTHWRMHLSHQVQLSARLFTTH